MKIRNCRRCNKEIKDIKKGKGYYSRFCSEDCRSLNRKDNYTKYNRKRGFKAYKIIICDDCGAKCRKRRDSRFFVCKRCIEKYRSRKFRENNPRRAKYHLKKYDKSFKGKSSRKVRAHRRLAKERKIVHKFSLEEWRRKIEETKGICPKCKNLVGKKKLTLDHIFPLSKAEEGRIYTINDVQPLCNKCNCSKGNRVVV